ncbi:hypothetical protein [Dongia sp.]|uniref:hypothetical protein n=1 Tax=Dongia sp. TaxID=1977262 RepID=UPI0037536974
MRQATQRSETRADPRALQRWLIEPNAAADDPWWQGRDIWQLVVAAPSAAFARLEAERWALRQHRFVPVGNESPSMNAGFIDEKLYFAKPLADETGPRLDEFDASTVMVLAGPMPSRASA